MQTAGLLQQLAVETRSNSPHQRLHAKRVSAAKRPPKGMFKCVTAPTAIRLLLEHFRLLTSGKM